MCLVLSPTCTLKSGEPELAPRCPLFQKYRLIAELGTPFLRFPGVLLQDSFATSWPHAGMSQCLSSVVSSGRRHRQASSLLQSALADPTAKRWWTRMLGAFSNMTLVEADPLCLAGYEGQSCLSTLATAALLWEARSRPISGPFAEYVNILYHVHSTGEMVFKHFSAWRYPFGR